jgi:hypothetical protein
VTHFPSDSKGHNDPIGISRLRSTILVIDENNVEVTLVIILAEYSTLAN